MLNDSASDSCHIFSSLVSCLTLQAANSTAFKQSTSLSLKEAEVSFSVLLLGNNIHISRSIAEMLKENI